jgi:hypothetical protein
MVGVAMEAAAMEAVTSAHTMGAATHTMGAPDMPGMREVTEGATTSTARILDMALTLPSSLASARATRTTTGGNTATRPRFATMRHTAPGTIPTSLSRRAVARSALKRRQASYSREAQMRGCLQG